MTDIALEELRSCVLEALRRKPQTQESLLRRLTAVVAAERGLLERTDAAPGSQTLPAGLWTRFRDVLWSLIIEGVVAQGINDANPSWPWLSVTEYGLECLAQGEILPHDPEGYLQALEADRPLDTVERRFLTQALEAYRRNLPDASAIMLGCASEHLVLVLARALVAADPTAETKTQQLIDKGTAKQLLDHVSKRLDPRAGGRSLPWQLEEMRATHFNGVAQIVRVARNDAGHPARQQPVDRDHCLVLLRLFPQYRAWVTQVLTHL